MRTDAQIDRQLVKLPNADTLGCGKWKAQLGDLVLFRAGRYKGVPPGDAGQPQLGRVAGRVHYAPMLAGDKDPVRDWLLVITLSHDSSFVMERWVHPEWVERCYAPTDKLARLWAFMLSDDFTSASADELREWSASGYSTMEEWQHHRPREAYPASKA
jgi:hypothetical protein